MNLIKRNIKTLAGALGGAIAGYCYYYFIGCASGSCLITSSPINSTLYGMVMGALLLNIFEKEKLKSE